MKLADFGWLNGQESIDLFIRNLPSELENSTNWPSAIPAALASDTRNAKFNAYQMKLLETILPFMAAALSHRPEKKTRVKDMKLLIPAIYKGVAKFRSLQDDVRRKRRSARGVGQPGPDVFQAAIWSKAIKLKVSPGNADIVAVCSLEARVLCNLFTYCQPESFSTDSSKKKDKADIREHIIKLLTVE